MFGTSTSTSTVEWIMLNHIQYDIIYGLLLGFAFTFILVAMKGRGKRLISNHMSSSTLSTLATDGITVFWGYITSLFPTLLSLAIGIAAVAVVFYLVSKGLRHIFNA